MANEAYPFSGAGKGFATDLAFARYIDAIMYGSTIIGNTGEEGQLTAPGGLTLDLDGLEAVVDGVWIKHDPTTVTFPSQPAGNGRVDRIVKRINRSTKTATTLRLAGTTSATPVAPALLETDAQFDMPLWAIYFPPSTTSISAANFIDERIIDGWRNFTPVVQQIGSGPIPTLVADSENRARYRLRGRTITVSWRGKVSLAAGAATGKAYGIRVPRPAFYFDNGTVASKGQVFAASVRNEHGFAVVDYSGSFDYGLVLLRHYDLADLTTPSGVAFDAFDATYECLQ